LPTNKGVTAFAGSLPWPSQCGPPIDQLLGRHHPIGLFLLWSIATKLINYAGIFFASDWRPRVRNVGQLGSLGIELEIKGENVTYGK
jgi:hypothetical protein